MSAVERKRRPLAARMVVIALCLILAWHFLATYTWSAAPNAVRAAIGQQTLKSYMIPMFGQSWAVFAPNPGSVNQNLGVRAMVKTADGTTTQTGWVSLTDHSTTEGIRFHPVPSRLYLNDFILANRYYDSAMAINEKTRDIAGRSYANKDWPDSLRSDFLAAIDQKDNPTIDSFIEYEKTVNALVSAVARAHWGDDVVQVQVRVLKTPVVPFAQRNEDVKPETTFFVDGWRTVDSGAGIDPDIFTSWYAKGAAR